MTSLNGGFGPTCLVGRSMFALELTSRLQPMSDVRRPARIRRVSDTIRSVHRRPYSFDSKSRLVGSYVRRGHSGRRTRLTLAC